MHLADIPRGCRRPWWVLTSPVGAGQVLGDDAARELCLRFADMECKLGEVDRARAIYTYCSQICDPRVSTRRRRGVGGGTQGWAAPVGAKTGVGAILGVRVQGVTSLGDTGVPWDGVGGTP